MWVLSFGSSLPFAFIPISIEFHSKVILYFSYAAQGLFLVISIITYTKVAFSLKSSKKKLGRKVKSDRNKNKIKKNYLISFLIILTFILFYLVPNYFQESNLTGFTIKVGVSYVGLSVDPILYIFLHKSLRPIAVDLLSWNGRLTCTYCKRKRLHQTQIPSIEGQSPVRTHRPGAIRETLV